LHLTREEVERLAGPLIDRAVDETRRLLDGVSRQTGGVSLAGILLVGGSSRIPLVATRLHGRFGVGPMVPEQPELPVALGALATLGDASNAAPSAASGGAAEPVSRAHPAQSVSGAHPAQSVSGARPATPAAQQPVQPVSGYPASGPVSAYPASGPVSAYPASGPVSAVPVSGDPGRAWTGQPAAQTSGAWAEQPSWPPAVPPGGLTQFGGSQAHAGGSQAPPAAGAVRAGMYGEPQSRTERRGSRATTIVAIAASVALLVLAGATIWFVRNALGSDSDNGSKGSGATNAAPAAASAAPTNTRPAPRDFAYCTVDGRQLLCPTKSVCYDEADDDVECSQPHATELYVANFAVADLLNAETEAVKSDPVVQSTCNETVMTARSADSKKTVNWLRYIQPLTVNGVAFIYCLAGPRPEGTTIVGPAFKLA
jgi:hypothetical protein